MVALRRVVVLILAAVLVLAAIQLALPRVIESRLEKELAAALPGARVVRAEVDAFPAVKLLWGRVDRLSLDVRRATFDGLVVDAALIDGRDLVIDAGRLLRREGVVITSAAELRATLAVAQDDLNEYLWSRLPDARGFQVSLERGAAAVTGAVNVLGRALDVRVSGSFRVEGPTQVIFVPEQVSVESARVPQFILDLAAQAWQIGLDFRALPFGLGVEELRIDEGQLLIYGSRPDRG